MKIYTGENVFDAAVARIRWLFEEFENVYVNFSGGKDSTVVLGLSLMVAEEMGRLPLKLVFIDQEAEWDSVIQYVRETMSDPRIEPWWFQMPIRISNATSQDQKWLYCWEEGKEEEWIRPKEECSIKKNVYGTLTFAQVFSNILRHHHPDEPACHLAGVRSQESPARHLALTTFPTYKGETWGKIDDKRRTHVTMYPVYDWSYTDVWKAIHDHGWRYCVIYDYMYQYGLPVMQMRVSNVHHETAVKTLMYIQELESETWNRITARIAGVNTAGQLREQFLVPRHLPPMFSSWKEYRDFLLEKMITVDRRREKMRGKFARQDKIWGGTPVEEKWHKTCILMILTNDHFDTRRGTFAAANLAHGKNRGKNVQKIRGRPWSGDRNEK